ncbi:MAG: hypothetical protein IT287_07235 [Bdellovibrionaceae bacterium]|nr:hypothetical protein [Pseudobdellovibrionaceae bacterium]
MIFIGIFESRLKKIASLATGVILSVFLLFPSQGAALSRELASDEIQKLENNIRKDPQNAASAKFLLQHYYAKQDWKNVVRVGQLQIKTLSPVQAMMMVEAYLAEGDGASAIGVIGHIHGAGGATGETKMWEARALSVMAQKEKTPIQRMNYANQAILVIRESVDLDPKNEYAYIEWVDILRTFWPHFAHDAMNVIKAMEAKTEDYESHNALKCELFTKAALWDQGAVACQRAIRANPKDVMSRLYFSEVQSVKIDPSERKKLLVTLAKDHPGHYDVQLALAHLYYDEQDYVSATNQYKKVVDIKKDDVASILRLAQSEFKIKQYVPALETYKKHCKNARMVASEFKDATKQLRSDKNLHRQYENAMMSCR